MSRTPSHAADLLVSEIVARLESEQVSEPAVRDALGAIVQQTEVRDGTLRSWVEAVIGQAVVVLRQRSGLGIPNPPSLAGLIYDEAAFDPTTAIVRALLEPVDPQLAGVVHQLEVRDAREAQVAVRLGMTPKRIAVMARQGREQAKLRLLHDLSGAP